MIELDNMSFWQATTKLRFIERTEYIKAASGDIHSTLRILQQLWTNTYNGATKWIDVPLEEESYVTDK